MQSTAPWKVVVISRQNPLYLSYGQVTLITSSSRRIKVVMSPLSILDSDHLETARLKEASKQHLGNNKSPIFLQIHLSKQIHSCIAWSKDAQGTDLYVMQIKQEFMHFK